MTANKPSYGPPPASGELASLSDPALVNKPVLICFAMRNVDGQARLQTLRQSCIGFGMDHSIETIPDTSLASQTFFKPGFIKFKLLTLGRPVIWFDINKKLQGDIGIPEGDWDIAAPAEKEAISPVAFRPTIAALRFLDLWEQLCSAASRNAEADNHHFKYTRQALAGRFVEVVLDLK